MQQQISERVRMRRDNYMTKEEYQKTVIFPVGEHDPQWDRYFTGKAYVANICDQQVHIGNVTFEPGCRNHWHIHTAKSGGGQLLICVGGRGYYQEWGKTPVEMNPGDVIHVPADVKHWHGAAPGSWFSHLNVEIEAEDPCSVWFGPSDQAEYEKLK
ncbi:MAG: cupin domain-containing protein [Firmicutes bacterium]|nr:cupin domain-containing protein [Bacillota bacterium]